MRNNLSILKLAIAASWLVAGFACGSPNQVNQNSNGNTTVVANSPANVTANKATPTPNVKDPKDACAYLPEYPTGEYKLKTSDIYMCKAEKKETLAGGKILYSFYEAVGTAAYVKYIEFFISPDGSAAEKLKQEKLFVQRIEKLWQKSFSAPLPEHIKKELETNQGKPATTNKDFADPVQTIVNRVEGSNGDYGLKIRFHMYKM